MDKQCYKELSNKIYADPTLVEETKTLMKKEIRKTKKILGQPFLRPAIGAAVIGLCFVCSVPVLAATSPKFQQIIYSIAPDFSQYLQPVELSSESNQIKIDVIAAMHDGETAVVYLAMQDLTSNRVDSSVDLYNYQIEGYTVFTHEVTYYDSETNTAILRLVANGGNKVKGKKVSLSIDSFLSNKVVYEDILLELEPNKSTLVETITLDMEHIPGGGGYGFDELKEKGVVPMLKPAEQPYWINDSIDFVNITGIGWINGQLHIQTQWEESIDNHGFILLRDNTGNEIIPTNVYFDVKDGQGTYGDRYVEYIFNINEEDIDRYKAYGTFVENGAYIEGDWDVTFKIEAMDEWQVDTRGVSIDGIGIEELAITPLGISAKGKDKELESLKVEVISDGEIISYDYVIANHAEGITKVKWVPNRPLEIDKLEALIINGQEIVIK